MQHQRHKRAAVIGAAAMGMVLTATACSSSSSDGTTDANGNPTPTASTTPSAPPTHTHTPSSVGPAGGKSQVTAPTSVAPTKGAIGGSEVFPHITDSQRQHYQKKLSKLAGVRTVTYYPQFKQLQVYFTDTATQAQKQAVISAVTGS